MASWPRETGGANERPNLAARCRYESRQVFGWHAVSNHSGSNRLRMCQFDLIAHTSFWLTYWVVNASRLPARLCVTSSESLESVVFMACIIVMSINQSGNKPKR